MHRIILTLVLLFGSSTTVNAAAADDSPQSSGTGFVVSRQGHILTNHHVVEGCASIRATVEGIQKEATVIGTDTRNDLAVLKLPGIMPSIAHFREGRNIRAGDSVVLVGFPLHGVLASEANITTGTVSALAGLGNDTRFLQMTAPVQPGNSGGPVFDQSGQIVGVVVSKLDALKVAKVTGDIPQNINFAINGAVAKAFLDSHGVGYETAASGKKLESAEIGAVAKQFTFLLECHSEKIGAEHRALEAERRALEAERRALDDERRALAEVRRTDQEARERVLRLEQEERARKAQVAAEQQRLQRQKEMAEAQAASERVIRFHEEEREREARENAQAQLEVERAEAERLTRETVEQEQRDRARLMLEQMKGGMPILAVRVNGNDGAPMILVPEGEFLYGEDNQKLSLPSFYLDAFEVTTKGYAAFMEATGHSKPEHWGDVSLDGHGMLPVIEVEYADAEAYCHYYDKRLPAEQEWEKAARGTDGRTYPWGNTEPAKYLANYGGQFCLIFCNVYAEKLKPVNDYVSGRSPYGIYNMAGNAWEWVEGRKLRGGSWLSNTHTPGLGLKIWNRTGEVSGTYGKRYLLGFRCAQDAR
ncbi:MAG: SUMF1/EgtB/PvdO family nonheme iron enzyme [Nitrospira sp.]|nr:SUMF1/EgtB/PvdO family nonheme iron enzyme [Nitrospira sp.]